MNNAGNPVTALYIRLSSEDSKVDRVYVYPGNQVEIVWKTEDFGMEGI